MSGGQLIAFTGVDGSGKTTQAKLLVERLNQNVLGVSYVWSRWSPLCLRPLIKKWKNSVTRNMDKSNHELDKIRDNKQRLLSKPVFRWLWIASFFIDYSLQMFVKIRIKMFRKRIIISDRIFYDSVIDQAINLGKRKDLLLDSMNFSLMKIFFPKPDLVIYIDCPEEIAFLRKADVTETGYIKERRKLYLKLADKYGWTKVDGTLPIDEIAVHVKDRVYNILGI